MDTKVYEKLQQARVKLQNVELKKSGHNKFAGYRYFELTDFLPTVNSIFAELGLCHTLEFTSDLATMQVIDTVNGGIAKFTCPMAEAHLKGCHPVQNLGASITYITRYLLVMALAICEHDALDATTGSDEPKSAKPITKSVFDTLDEQSQDEIKSYAADVIMMIHKDQVEEAVEYINSLELDADWKTALWSQLDSKQRSAIKKFTKG
jgi:ERF superfamily